jgi:hypothetical protein
MLEGTFMTHCFRAPKEVERGGRRADRGCVVARLCFVLAALGGPAVRAAPTVKEVREILSRHGVVGDSEIVEASAVAGFLSALDRHAGILTEAEVSALTTGRSVTVADEWPQSIGYLRTEGLRRDAGREITGRLDAWMSRGLKAFVIDLRGAGGNDLESLDRIAGRFAATNATLYRLLNSSNRVVAVHRAGADALLAGRADVVVLVDGRTSGASEMLAALLKHRPGVLLLGSRTEGDARHREVIPLPDGRFLYVATQRFAPGDGPPAGADGVEPDLAIGTNAIPTPEVRRDQVHGVVRAASEAERVASDLARRAGGDPALVGAADALLALRALNLHASATNTTSSAGR